MLLFLTCHWARVSWGFRHHKSFFPIFYVIRFSYFKFSMFNFSLQVYFCLYNWHATASRTLLILGWVASGTVLEKWSHPKKVLEYHFQLFVWTLIVLYCMCLTETGASIVCQVWVPFLLGLWLDHWTPGKRHFILGLRDCLFDTCYLCPGTIMVVGAPLLTIFFHLWWSSVCIWMLLKSRPVHSLMLSSNLFFFLPLFLFPGTVPCKIFLMRPIHQTTCTNHRNFLFSQLLLYKAAVCPFACVCVCVSVPPLCPHFCQNCRTATKFGTHMWIDPRWTLNRHHNTSSVKGMLEDLQWRTLEQRRTDCRLVLLFQIIHGLVQIPPTNYLQPSLNTKCTNPLYFSYTFFYFHPFTILYICKYVPTNACAQETSRQYSSFEWLD